MATAALSIADFVAAEGSEIGVSDWVRLDQDRIDRFADCTLDRQFIHVDPDRAARTDFGGTIAHGFLSLSMLSVLSFDAVPPIEGSRMGLNYGFDRVRFLSPVRSGSRIRARFVLKQVKERRPGEWAVTFDVTVEIADVPKPALVAEWLTITIVGD